MRREFWRFAYLAEPLHGIMSVRSDKYGRLSRRAGRMRQPQWNDPELDAGVMIRGSLWLIQEIGVGNVFTKADIRTAFPDASQADRRIRDLRDHGWVLHTRADDASLQLEQTRLVAIGTEVWDPRARRASSPNKGISSKARDAIMARDDYMCTVCGITGGEAYPDDSTQTAVLAVAKRTGNISGDAWATICKRCKAGGAARVDIVRAAHVVSELAGVDREAFARWTATGRREVSPAERAWSMYLRLPDEARATLLANLDIELRR